jgi:hypothetical protein
MRFVVVAAAGLVLQAASAEGVHFPSAQWEQRDPSSLGLDGAMLDRLAEALGGRGCVIKDGYVVKTWGVAIGDW